MVLGEKHGTNYLPCTLELLQNDKIQDLIFAYSTTLQKEAFCAGYKKGMLLIMEIIGNFKS